MEQFKSYHLAIGLIISSIIFGLFFYSSRQQESTVKVVGYAIESFESDIVRWSMNISETTEEYDLINGYKRLNNKIKTFKQILESMKLDSLDIFFKPISINDVYDRNGLTSNKKLTQSIIITSKSLTKVEELSTNPSIFIEKSILFEYSNVAYYYSKLDMIKKQLLGKAIINAKARAEEITQAVGNEVGDLITARSGVFQITEPLSTEVAGYGLHSTSTKKKNIKVTVSAEFIVL